MINDTERREVARRLREVNPYRNYSYTIPYHRYTPAAEYLAELAGALGYSPKNDVSRLEFQSRLADLIDPDTTTDTTKTAPDTTKCDRDALLELADEMDMDAGCHAYVDDYEVYGYARRIRDALGVES